ncbi:hypothetical protein J2Z66_000343 [Paenibacillus eucommiae]|uniref:Uncharacterized protein n=1 Tax=Paenibacillus eucommiae TaxID=1355755 RepID=A0ABS4IME9_9BACL|nr:hypothetical protein [Paenibacillus eucommiae]
MTMWNYFWIWYHKQMSRLYKIEGAFQSHKFIHHRNKLKMHKNKLNK